MDREIGESRGDTKMEKDTQKEVTYSPSKEFVKRFLEKTKGEITEAYFISRDREIGIPRFFNERHYLELGTVKIVRRPREKDSIIVLAKEYGVEAKDFFLAMYLLRRRKYITLGVYLDRPETLPELFVASSRGEHIFIAPNFLLSPYYPTIKIEDLIEEVPESLKVWQLMRNLKKEG